MNNRFTALKKNKGAAVFFALLFVMSLLLVILEIRASEPLVYKGGGAYLAPYESAEGANTAKVEIKAESETLCGVQIKVTSAPESGVNVGVYDERSSEVARFALSGEECDGVFRYHAFSEAQSGVKEKTYTVVAEAKSGEPVGVTVRPVYNVLNYNALTAVLCFAALIAAAVIFLVFYKNGFTMKEEKVFLLLFSVCGLFFFAAIPFFRGPDEQSHFLRAFEISMGRFISPGTGELPSGLGCGRVDGSITLRYIAENIGLCYDPAVKQGYSYLNTALYSPVNYLPQALGIFIARLFTENIWVIGYAAKLANFISTGAVLYYSIKHTPVGKNIFIAVALLPMSLQCFTVITADGLALAFAMALTAFVLYMRYDAKEKMTKKQRVLLYVIPFVLSMCKIVYLPLCLLLFLIPKERFSSKKDYWLSVAAVGSMIAAVNLGWLLIASPVLQTPFNAGVDSPAQLRYILEAPFSFVWACVKTMLINGRVYFEWMIGGALGWLNIGISWVVIDIMALCLISAAVFDKGLYGKKKNGSAALMALCALLVFALTLASLYIQFTAYKSGMVDGFQGRYLLPVLAPILLAVSAIHPKEKLTRSMNGLYLTLGVMNIAAALCALVQTL